MYCMNNTCNYCGDSISTSKKFCNMKCYNAHKRINQVKLTCNFCNKEFATSKNRSEIVLHCSRKCYIKSASESGNRICKDCKELQPIGEFNLHSPAKDIRRRYCKKCELKRVRTKSQDAYTRWKHSERRAARSGEVWEIPLENYKNLIAQNCHYCDGELNPTGCGLDRKNNEVGYLLTNVVPCCRQCNTVKNHFFSYEDMLLLSVVIKQIKNKKGESHSHGK